MEANPLDPIRHLVNAGDERGARLALAELLEAEPDNADAWALLAILLTHTDEQAQCYREILRITPDDRQAAAWLASLTGQAAPPPEKGPLPGGEQGPDSQPPPRADELDRVLEDVVLPDAGDQMPPPPVKVRVPQRQTQPKGFLDGLLDRLRGRTSEPEPEVEAMVLGQDEVQSAAGSLSPELILRLAGGPLAPEERRNCPKCDAVVSRSEKRCPWCSAPLPQIEDREP